MNVSEIIRRKRDGIALDDDTLRAFVSGIADDSIANAQIAAFAMAVYFQGMTSSEAAALTSAMADSGEMLSWDAAELGGPVVDKHSTGGVGDKTSLVLAPIAAACGLFVPMISGRGLGHTGGTLDKLATIKGYNLEPSVQHFRQVVRAAGCAIVGQTAEMAPADKRLYAIRDVTATVDSIPLITASILSKKLAAGIHGLVMDVKVGSGAVLPDADAARALARSLVDTAVAAGVPTYALITDMNQMLGTSVGNALEVQEACDFLTGERREPRFAELLVSLAASMLQLGDQTIDQEIAEAQIHEALDSGRAADRFATMVTELGGPSDFIERYDTLLPVAPVCIDLLAPQDGVVGAWQTRDVGLALIDLGGGRMQPDDVIEPGVGFDRIVPVGTSLSSGDRVCRIHASSAAAAEAAGQQVLTALTLVDESPSLPPIIHETLK